MNEIVDSINYLSYKRLTRSTGKDTRKLTACILANKNSNIRDVIPRSGLDLSPRLLTSPSIVYVLPLPVYTIIRTKKITCAFRQEKMKDRTQKIEGEKEIIKFLTKISLPNLQIL